MSSLPPENINYITSAMIHTFLQRRHLDEGDFKKKKISFSQAPSKSTKFLQLIVRARGHGERVAWLFKPFNILLHQFVYEVIIEAFRCSKLTFTLPFGSYR